MNKIKLFVAIPCYDTAEAEFLKCFADLLIQLQRGGYDFEVRVMSGTLVYLAREELATIAVKEGFTHVLWLDTDMVFEPDIFDRMLATGKKFVAAAYRSRHGRYVICATKDLTTCKLLEELPDKPFHADAVGFGIVLIETSVLRAVRHAHGTCFDANIRLGEDFEFCRKALSCGQKAYVDPTIQAGHIGRYAIWPDNIDLLREYEKKNAKTEREAL